MRLAIVGSVGLAGSPEAYSIIFAEIARSKPTIVVSGGARGIDSMAAEVAAFLSIPTRIYRPANERWAPDGYRERNLLIAGDCDRIVRIVASTSRTYGSGWTRDQAVKWGVVAIEYLVDA